MEKVRRIVSTFLLAVYLSAVLASTFHRHPEHTQGPECEQCVHHLPHAGHIGTYEGALSDCVLCQFLGIPYILTLAAALLLPMCLFGGIISPLRETFISSYRQHTRSRAPPVLYFA
ncbi:MAG: hypothetical protein IKV62_10685 [Bacteroidales bacterium]|nr:hypothetical protein [Bacteroidales bacterium]